MRRILFTLIFLLLAACSPQIPPNTGIQGQVFIGPTCPVVQLNNPCPDQAYQATLVILTTQGRKVAQVTSDAAGHFRLPLAPGDYYLQPKPPVNSPMPHAPEQPFSVVAGQFTLLKVTYDSGIR